MEYCIFTEPQQGATYDELLRCAQATERLGFTGFFRSDHYLAMGGDGLPGPSDAWTSLAGLARETERVRLGTLVSSVTFRHPGVLAIQVAQVDEMSGGRVELGLGTGWYAAEHSAYGIPFPEKRFGLLEEQLEVITRSWATPIGERYSFDGAHYSLVDSPAMPKPIQAKVPVIVGGGGPTRTPAIAARYADEFNIGFQREAVLAEKIAGVKAAAERIGRDPESLRYSVALTTFAGGNEAEVLRRGAEADRSPEQTRSEANIWGDAERIAEKVARLAELGAQRVYFQVLNLRDLEHIEYLGREVLPKLP
ncbi:MAG: LLM class F420-dependent oxidoreductase [Microbacteriaceae bacterium]|nr:LLM class F420-dependent oxidoreductase [Microbacteriaceae bacterium]HOA86935.1 LLM class F420-dependent oxidoreductase [Microbacteriaceae bacterium]HPZ33717.1 LLM class F420-dependent oxidoreductase [Microbacteriaceae bacterium]HQC92813.1 LLM class F420-dependent oxidoreductase [Microbacteriaceae bacterium]